MLTFFVIALIIIGILFTIPVIIHERQSGKLQAHEKGADEVFYTKVAGVTKRTPNGESRQKIIEEKLMQGVRVDLLPEPDNRHDPDAIKVITEYGHHIGYIPADVASGMVRDMRTGKRFTAVISDITGGQQGKRTRGVNLQIGVHLPNKLKK